MRHLGTIAEQTQAERFGYFLASQPIEAEVRPRREMGDAVWVGDQDRVTTARQPLLQETAALAGRAKRVSPPSAPALGGDHPVRTGGSVSQVEMDYDYCHTGSHGHSVPKPGVAQDIHRVLYP